MSVTIYIVKGARDERAYVSTWAPTAERRAALEAQGYKVFSVIVWLPLTLESTQALYAQDATVEP